MSTRGCVAIGTPEHWVGVYNHFDSYPTGLGRELWEHLEGEDLQKFASELLKYDEWRHYLNKGVCPYCGKKGVGHPHTIRGDVYGFDSPFFKRSELPEEIRRNIEETGYPDPEVKWHKHASLDDKITSDSPDPLFIEWVYVVEPEARMIHILTSVLVEDTWDRPVKTPEKLEGNVWDYGHCKCKHELVKSVSLDEPEPDWEEIEDLVNAMEGE